MRFAAVQGTTCHRRIVMPCRRRNLGAILARSSSPRQFARSSCRDLDGRAAVPVRTPQPSVASNTSLPLQNFNAQAADTEHGVPQPAATGQGVLDLCCAVCLDRERTYGCMPCGHRALCEHCDAPENLARLNYTCPICRAEILFVSQIYL